MYHRPEHNDHHVQFKLSAAQFNALGAHRLPGLSMNLTAKHLLLQTLDPPHAEQMAVRAAAGKKRLSDYRDPR